MNTAVVRFVRQEYYRLVEELTEQGMYGSEARSEAQDIVIQEYGIEVVTEALDSTPRFGEWD